MNIIKLHLRSLLVILKRECISFLEKISLKDTLRKIFIEKKLKNNSTYISDTEEIHTDKGVILVLPNIPWNFRKQRPQQIFSRLGKKGFTIFYCNPITSSQGIKQVSEGVYEINISTKEHRNILREFDFDDSFVDEYVISVKKLLEKYMDKDPILFVLHPVWGKFVEKLQYEKLYYDMMDLYAGFPDAEKGLIKNEEDLVKNCNAVITTADSLYEYSSKLNSNVHMIKNGCDFDMFSSPKKNGLLDSLEGKPIIGYYGALTDWVDVELLEHVIKKNKDKWFVFIAAINSNRFRKLYKYKHVFFLGEVDNTLLPGYLAYFNVCTIPFVLNDLIKSTNPVKFYEYIASGKAVVSVRLPELNIYEDICYLSDSKESFSEKISDALKENSENIVKKRQGIAMENDWDKRVIDLMKILEIT